MEITSTMWTIIGILAVIQVILMVIGILDWNKQPKNMPNRMVWLIIIIVLNTIGPLSYFLIAPRNQVPLSTGSNDVWQ
jgi:hypothetical protein